MIELSITDSAKKKLVKSDILGLRYKQFSGGGVKKKNFKKEKNMIFSIFEIRMLQKWIEIMDLILVFL